MRIGILGTLVLCSSCQELSARAAHRAAREGRLEDADRAYARLVAAAPGELDLRAARAAVLLRLGRLEAAEAVLGLPRSPGAEPASLREARAELALARGLPGRALEALDGGDGTPARGDLVARALLARGEAGDAALALEALGPLPTGAAPRAYLAAQALLALGRAAEAEAALEGLVASAPAWAHYGLARVAAARADAPGAERALARARAAAGGRWRPEAVAADPAFDFLRERPSLTTSAP